MPTIESIQWRIRNAERGILRVVHVYVRTIDDAVLKGRDVDSLRVELVQRLRKEDKAVSMLRQELGEARRTETRAKKLREAGRTR